MTTIAAAILMVSCGGSANPNSSSATLAPSTSAPATSQAAQSGPVDACKLATQSEVDTAAGVSLGPPVADTKSGGPGSSKCGWTVSGAPAAGLFEQGITVVVLTLPAGVAATSLPMFNGQLAQAHPISGLGDAAVSLSPGQLGPGSVQIFVATHASLVTVSLVNSGSAHAADPVQSMTTLAHAVVGRVP